MVARRQCMHSYVRGFLAPTDLGLRPQGLWQGVLAQIKLANRCAVFHRRADKGVLIPLRDRRRTLHLYGHRHVTPCTPADLP